jgi:hypothetical protein
MSIKRKLERNLWWVVPIFLFFFVAFVIHSYYESSNVPLEKYLATTPHQSYGFVYVKDLPCGSSDVICWLSKANLLTFIAPSSVSENEQFALFISNTGESWKGSYSNTLKYGTNGNYPCSAGEAEFWLERDSTKYGIITNEFKFATGAGECYAQARYYVTDINVNNFFFGKVEISVDGNVVDNKEKRITVEAPSCSFDNLHDCLTDSDCTHAGGEWCKGECVDERTICACDAGWGGTAYCSSGNVWQSRTSIDCSVTPTKKYDCLYGCLNGECEPKPVTGNCTAGYSCKTNSVVAYYNDKCEEINTTECLDNTVCELGKCVSSGAICGDGICALSEDATSCAIDCEVTDGDGDGNIGNELPPYAILIIFGILIMLAMAIRFSLSWRR